MIVCALFVRAFPFPLIVLVCSILDLKKKKKKKREKKEEDISSSSESVIYS